MKKLNRILVPTDFSEGSRKAYAYAESLLNVFGGKIDMINIVRTSKYIHESMKKVGYPFSLDQDVYPQIIEQTEDKVKAELQKYISRKHRGQAIVKIGRRCHEIILEHAHEHKYDMIAMGAQGKHAGTIIRGHVTEKVIRYSDVPVLSISGDMMPSGTNNIVVPTDFSDLSMRAILPAAIMAGRLKSVITLLNVKELHGTEPDEDNSLDEQAVVRFRSKVEKKVRSFLESKPKARLALITGNEGAMYLLLEREDEQYRIEVQTSQVRGISAHYEIVDYAEEHADMIVIATHGRSGFSHIFLGSTAEKVVQAARIPVISIRPKEMISQH